MAVPKRTLLDLPSETIALIFENATDHDLAQLCRVSRAIRELAAAELYRNLNHSFNEDPVTSKLGVDYLAGFLETLVTSDYNYAGHVKEVFVDTGYTAAKGEQACRQFGYDLTCGKFLNTLLLAALKRTQNLEGLYWNARIELSVAVLAELHRMPNLRRVHMRLQAGPSLHAVPDVEPVPTQSGSSPSNSPISPLVPHPPGPQSPGGYGYAQPTPPGNTFRMVPKIPVTKLASQHRSFSGFKNLKSLGALDMDTLEYIPEIAECVHNSAENLKQLEISLSDSFGRKARDKPRVAASDGATSDDASSMASQPHHAADGGAPVGSNPEQLRQWHKARQETILNNIFAPKSSDAVSRTKDVEIAASEVVARAVCDSQKEFDLDPIDTVGDDEDRKFVRSMRAIFREVRSKPEMSSNGSKAMDKVEKAATKYLESRTKRAAEAKPKIKSKAGHVNVKAWKAPPGGPWQFPQQSSSHSHKSFSVHEDVLLDYFSLTKTDWDQMVALNKNDLVQTYFKETQGLGYHPYPMAPAPAGKPTNYNKMYYATPTSVPGYAGPTKYTIAAPSKKTKKPSPVLPKHGSDSDSQNKVAKITKPADAENGLAEDPLASPTTKREKEDNSEDTDLSLPSEDEDKGSDQQFATDEEVSDREDTRSKRELVEVKEGIDDALLESGLIEENGKSSDTVDKGKQAVRDPPNGHLVTAEPTKLSPTSSQQQKENEEQPQADNTVADSVVETKQEDPVSRYLRLSHGLPVERLAIYLVPVKAATLLQHFDAYALKQVTLLNVGSQRRIWASLTKLQRQSPLSLSSIYTDNVSPALLTFIESLRAGQLDDLFLLERYLRKKGRVPQLQDCDKTTVEMDAIRKQILKKHMKGFRRLMIRNDDSESWAMNNAVVRLVARQGFKLRELAVQCDTRIFHNLIRSLPSLTELCALQINFILDAATPPISMTGVGVSASHHHHYGANTIEPHTPASATILEELRQAVVDGLSFCRNTTQLEWLGFSWLQGGRQQTHLDGEGNPYVFLSRVVRDYGPPEDEEDDEYEEGDSGHEDEEKETLYMDGGHVDNAGPSNSNGVENGIHVKAEDDKSTTANTGLRIPDTKQQDQHRQRHHETSTFRLCAENDLNISHVQDVRIWDKEIWAGRL